MQSYQQNINLIHSQFIIENVENWKKQNIIYNKKIMNNFWNRQNFNICLGVIQKLKVEEGLNYHWTMSLKKRAWDYLTWHPICYTPNIEIFFSTQEDINFSQSIAFEKYKRVCDYAKVEEVKNRWIPDNYITWNTGYILLT